MQVCGIPVSLRLSFQSLYVTTYIGYSPLITAVTCRVPQALPPLLAVLVVVVLASDATVKVRNWQSHFAAAVVAVLPWLPSFSLSHRQ